jgi:hypothetical protein
LPVIPAARFGDLSYGLYIYGWPVEQAVERGRCRLVAGILDRLANSGGGRVSIMASRRASDAAPQADVTGGDGISAALAMRMSPRFW